MSCIQVSERSNTEFSRNRGRREGVGCLTLAPVYIFILQERKNSLTYSLAHSNARGNVDACAQGLGGRLGDEVKAALAPALGLVPAVPGSGGSGDGGDGAPPQAPVPQALTCGLVVRLERERLGQLLGSHERGEYLWRMCHGIQDEKVKERSEVGLPGHVHICLHARQGGTPMHPKRSFSFGSTCFFNLNWLVCAPSCAATVLRLLCSITHTSPGPAAGLFQELLRESGPANRRGGGGMAGAIRGRTLVAQIIGHTALQYRRALRSRLCFKGALTLAGLVLSSAAL